MDGEEQAETRGGGLKVSKEQQRCRQARMQGEESGAMEKEMDMNGGEMTAWMAQERRGGDGETETGSRSVSVV